MSNLISNLKVKEIKQKYELSDDELYINKDEKFWIVNRFGIEKIQIKEGLYPTYNVIQCTPTFSVIRATLKFGDKAIETFASALQGSNTDTSYVIELCEKRAKSRVILQALGLYSVGFFSEDESDDFKSKGKANTERSNELIDKTLSKLNNKK